MSNLNSVTVSGNLTRDPEVKWLADDEASGIVETAVAVNRRFKKGDEYVEEVSFFDVKVFGAFALTVARKLKKGDLAAIVGRLEQQTWETAEGDKRSKVVIIVNDIECEGLFRAKDEDAAISVSTGTSAPSAAAPATADEPTATAPTDDDIPF